MKGEKTGLEELVLATTNPGKIREFKGMLTDLNIEILTLQDFPPLVAPTEDGESFVENAIIKAKYYAHKLGKPALADDSGLEVEYLHGAPGVLSARLAGEHATDFERNRYLLSLLAGVPWEERKARFVCILALACPQGRVETARGELLGYIAEKPAGKAGFGYDPVFYLPAYGATTARLGPTKNKISHRAQALVEMRKIIRKTQQSIP